MNTLITLMEQGKIPRILLSYGIKAICAERLFSERTGSIEGDIQRVVAFSQKLRTMPIALVPEKANEQHYEVPPAFYKLTLGKHLKYSSAYFAEGVTNLDTAEEAMLNLTCQRAELQDGMKILELGCGWGSLTLFMAARFPHAQITGVSNSYGQREHILNEAAARGLTNIRILTGDINDLDITETTGTGYDRVVSVEMFEHLRNYHLLFKRIAAALAPQGKLFIHIFVHKKYAYEYETTGSTNWLGKYFFTGGMMPSDSLVYFFQDDLVLENHWRVLGTHYSKTARAWRLNLENRWDEAVRELEEVYGKGEGVIWANRWKVFFMACEELFGFMGGTQWWVSHYLLHKR
jgi:cyclopropane-fatty-acyl-phospholipid synthase